MLVVSADEQRSRARARVPLTDESRLLRGSDGKNPVPFLIKKSIELRASLLAVSTQENESGFSSN